MSSVVKGSAKSSPSLFAYFKGMGVESALSRARKNIEMSTSKVY